MTAAELYDEFGSQTAAGTIAALKRAAAAEPEITRSVVAAAGGADQMFGLEFRMKEPRSLASKIQRKVELNPHRTPEETADRVADVLRYTVRSDDHGALVDRASSTISSLLGSGWSVREAEHSYADGNPYKGIHTILHDPRSGQDVEIQFHSAETSQLKEQWHREYEVMRDTTRPLAEREAAYTQMVNAWRAIPDPGGLVDLKLGDLYVSMKIYRRTPHNDKEPR